MLRRNRYIPAFILLALAPALSQAAVFTYVTPAGSQSAKDGAVSAKAVFTTGDGTLTIDIYNMLSTLDVHSVGQNVSDLFFTLSNDTDAGTVGSSTSTFVDIAKGDAKNNIPNGVVTFTSSDHAGPDLMAWGFSVNSGVYHLDGLSGGETPENTILGGTEGDSSDYTNANSSIAGNDPHNPFAQGHAHWVLNMSGVNADTDVTGATFSFGTTAGDNVKGVVPEPASMAALAIGAIALIRRRKSAK